MTGDDKAIDASREARALAEVLSDDGASQVIVVEWNLSGSGSAKDFGVEPEPGLTDILIGKANFETAIQRLPKTQVHFIAGGSSLDATDADVDPAQLNLVLDALDEVYDFIVVYASLDEARILFEAIQGRFDAGVLVCDPKTRIAALDDPAGTFLGFEVTDIDIVRLERKLVETSVSQQRMMRVTKKELSVTQSL